MKSILHTAVFAAFILAGCSVPNEPVNSPYLAFTFLNVGQGDAALVRFPEGRVLLMDAGSEGCGSDMLLVNQGVRVIDDFVLSHPHEDHFGNLRAVLARCRVNRVIFNQADFPQNEYPDFYPLFRYITDTLRLDTLILSAGRPLPGYREAQIVSLSPGSSPCLTTGPDSVNERSLVLEIRYHEGAALFTGDIGFETEKQLLENGWLKPVRMLKVAHHGSKASTSAAFLRALSPLVSILSTGPNSFGHPTAETLLRLSQNGTLLFRTDVQGTTRIWMDEAGGILSDRKGGD